MAEKKSGLAAVPSGLFRPTTEPTPVEPVDDLAVEQEGQGGDASATEAAPKARVRKKGPAAGKTRSRNIRLSDDTHDRLWLLARQRRQTISATADELLNKVLPRWEVKRSG